MSLNYSKKKVRMSDVEVQSNPPSTSQAPAKRGRGRPKKEDQKPKNGIDAPVDQSQTNGTQEKRESRRRGRKPAEKPIENNNVDVEENNGEVDNGDVDTGKGTKRGRGRPKGSKNSPAKKSKTAKGAKKAGSGTGKRGRPKKNATNNTNNVNSNSNNNVATESSAEEHEEVDGSAEED